MNYCNVIVRVFRQKISNYFKLLIVSRSCTWFYNSLANMLPHAFTWRSNKLILASKIRRCKKWKKVIIMRKNLLPAKCSVTNWIQWIGITASLQQYYKQQSAKWSFSRGRYSSISFWAVGGFLLLAARKRRLALTKYT